MSAGWAPELARWDLDKVPAADLAQLTAPLPEPDRARLREYWSKVIEAAYAAAGTADLDRAPRRVVRRESSRLLRVVPAARRRVSGTHNDDEEAGA